MLGKKTMLGSNFFGWVTFVLSKNFWGRANFLLPILLVAKLLGSTVFLGQQNFGSTLSGDHNFSGGHNFLWGSTKFGVNNFWGINFSGSNKFEGQYFFGVKSFQIWESTKFGGQKFSGVIKFSRTTTFLGSTIFRVQQVFGFQPKRKTK
jgi:hypothetical protein